MLFVILIAVVELGIIAVIFHVYRAWRDTALDLKSRLNRTLESLEIIKKSEVNNKCPARIVKCVRVYRIGKQDVTYHDVTDVKVNGDSITFTQCGFDLTVTKVQSIKEFIKPLKYNNKSNEPLYLTHD